MFGYIITIKNQVHFFILNVTKKYEQWLSVIEANMFIPEIELSSLLIDCSVAMQVLNLVALQDNVLQ